MLDRRAMLASLQQQSPSRELPPEYQAVEWIQSRYGGGRYNTSYINLDEPYNESLYDYKIQCGYIPYASGLGSYGIVIGWANNSVGDFSAFLMRRNASFGWNFYSERDFVEVNYNFETETEYDVEICRSLSGRNYFKVNDTVLDDVNHWNHGSNNHPFWLFGNNDVYATIQDRFTYCKIWRNDTLWKDLVPCYNKITGVAGMYDFISESFYSSNGPTQFAKGADI